MYYSFIAVFLQQCISFETVLMVVATCNLIAIERRFRGAYCRHHQGAGGSKAKAVPLHATEAHVGERSYGSYSFSTSALDGGEWSASCPGRALPRGEGPSVPIVQEAGWAPEPVWIQRLEEKSFRLCRESNLDRPLYQLISTVLENFDGITDCLRGVHLLTEFTE
jgi:hypothetical protein